MGLLEAKGAGRVRWWKKVVDGVEGREGEWFWGKMEQELGDGGLTKFWESLWTGDQSLKEGFPRLFQLSNKKFGKVGEMGRWENGCWS